MKVFIVVLFAIIAIGSFGQNLVPNPSFEEFYILPNSFSGSTKDFNLPGWNSPNKGTPDQFHSSCLFNCDVPDNWAGRSYAHTGKGYVGIFVAGRQRNNKCYREYIQCTLTESLKKGKVYSLEFYFKLSSYSVYSSDRIGLALTDSLEAIPNDQAISMKPIISVIRSPYDAGNWELASLLYTANGGESNLIIGNFFDDENTSIVEIPFRYGKSEMLSGSAYFYIDDVRVICNDSTNDSLFFVGNDIPFNKIYTLKRTYFSFNSDNLVDSSFQELDKVVEVLKSNSNCHIQVNGHADDIGSDSYNLDLSTRRSMAIKNYLVAKGINSVRIEAKGFGNSVPLVENLDDKSRAINRRVEIIFLLDEIH